MNEPREVVAVPVLTPSTEQATAFREKVEEITLLGDGIRAQSILFYYRLGQALVEVFEDRARGGVRYGDNAIGRLADEVGHDPSTLYRAQEVAVRFTEEQIAAISALPRVRWSHVLEVVRLPSAEARMEVLSGLPALPATQQTVASLRQRVATLRKEMGAPEPSAPAVGETAEATPAATSPKTKGGGSRTGTGHGSSPLTPIRRVGKSSEALVSGITDMVITIKEFDPDSEAVAEKMAKSLDASAGVMVEALVQIAGSLGAVEEYLASFNCADSNKARRSMVSQAITELRSFLDGEKQADAVVVEDKKEDKAVREELASSAKRAPARAEARPVAKSGPAVSKDERAAVIAARREAALADVKRRT